MLIIVNVSVESVFHLHSCVQFTILSYSSMWLQWHPEDFFFALHLHYKGSSYRLYSLYYILLFVTKKKMPSELSHATVIFKKKQISSICNKFLLV